MAGGNIMKLKKHPIYKAIFSRFKSQAKKGVSKYGALVQSENLTHQEWLEHAAEELTDLLVYIQCAKEADSSTFDDVIVKIKNRDARITELERALDYYAQKESYEYDPDLMDTKIVRDSGKRARKALGYAEED